MRTDSDMSVKGLIDHLNGLHVPAERRRRLLLELEENIRLTSPFLLTRNFDRIHPDDLRLLYELYDELFFQGRLSKAVGRQPLSFRLSRRMTRAGGTTTQYRPNRSIRQRRYEIAISTTLLFESFREPEATLMVTGLECVSRLEALLRIMEHELIHLTEMLIWDDSSCSQKRFQNIASGMFGHRDHRHELITPSDTASQAGVRPGGRVRFDYEGHSYEGIVNRITRRATVLVADPRGSRFSDGNRYLRFYIPVRDLEPVD